MKNLGETSFVIAIKIYRDRSRGILGLSQRAYINKILKKYIMQNCSPTVAPVVKGDKFGAYQCLKNKLEQEEMRLKPYASVVGSLAYAQVCTHPDIAYITGMLGCYQSNPGKEHWKAAKKVLRYLQGTKNSISTSGYIFMLSGGPISWRSYKQELTTTSTMMAEYVACYHATSHAILLRNLIFGLKVVDSISRPIRLYCDNSSVVRFSNSTSSTGAGLYLETKYLYVREKVEDNIIVMEYISTHDMLADPLTKGLPPKLFLEHVSGMGLNADAVVELKLRCSRCTWMAFGENTCDLGSFREETDKTTTLHQILRRNRAYRAWKRHHELQATVSRFIKRQRHRFDDSVRTLSFLCAFVRKLSLNLPLFALENANPPSTNNPPVLPTALRAKTVQELNELQAILTYIDSRLENID
ncbi:hypothetical protein Tco_0501647 [Tanacetum coccineum]